MSMIDSFTKKVTNTYKAAAKKSSEIVEITKINLKIETEFEEIEKILSKLGRYVYDNNLLNDTLDDELKALFKEIKSKEHNIENLKKIVLDLKCVKICPSCKAENDIDMLFCPSCGNKQEEVKDEAKDKICPSCNTVNKSDFTFCSKCGNKFD